MCTLVSGAFMAAAAAASNGSDLRSDHPEQYTVVRTRCGIFLRDFAVTRLWPEIWQANPSIQNPHLIEPRSSETGVCSGQPDWLLIETA